MSFFNQINAYAKALIYRKRFEHRLCFFHIPKCGGTSIDEALKKHYARPLGINREGMIFNLNSEASLTASRLFDMELASYREQLLLYAMAKKDNRYISGHFTFSDIAFSAFKGQWDFITILRNPVNRYLSHYFFNRFKTSNHFKTDDDLLTHMSSVSGLSQGHFLIYYLTGEGAGQTSVSSETVDKAIKNLEKFTLIGCLEHLDHFQKQFESRYHIPLKIPVRNRNPLDKKKQNQSVDQDTRQRIEEICQPDLKVYHHALSLIGIV